jgi:acyl-CoA ligase (AMP-forming) (exosortase A-associated)
MTRLDALLARGHPDATALVDRERSLTYGALDAQVSAVAAALARRVPPGARIAIWLPKGLEAVVLAFAVARAGAVAVPVNPVLRSQQVAHILDDSGAALLVSHRARTAGLAGLFGLSGPTHPVLTVEDDWGALIAAAPAAMRAPGGDALAALLYTSGSTGRPKGVMVSHANLLTGARSVAGYLGTRPDDRVLAVLPLSFDLGFSQVTTAFHAGAAAVLLDYLTPRDVVQAATRHGATQLAAVPPLWVQLAALDWPAETIATLRTLSNSGGRLPVPTVHDLRRKFPHARLHLMYGLTEAFRSTTLPPELVDSHPASIGRAIPEAEILVVRPDGSLTADNEPGELVHCGPLVSRGYWQDPGRTAERFRAAPPASTYGGTAVWSGDTVVRDADGLLTFIGRADETIKTMGTRVSPTEIEELAHQSGAVAQAVALGIADEMAGQRIRLVAAAIPGVPEADAEASLRAHFKREAAPFMQPAGIVWLDALPISANGKLDRAAIRERFGE